MLKIYEELYKRDYKYARQILSRIDDSNIGYILSPCCFYTQEAVVKLLKHLLYINDVTFPLEHNIKKMINLLDENNISYDERILAYTDILYDWEDDSRYDANFKVSKEMIVEIHTILEEMINSVNTK